MAGVHRELVALVRSRYVLDWDGIHGVSHWARVRVIGLRLARETGADTKVVELFAFLHDSCRTNDGDDPEHGPRAARLARELNSSLLSLDPHRLGLLEDACRDHTLGFTTGDVTVQTCWDADRLDLGRVGIRPHASRLCTEAARAPAMIDWAWQRSRLRGGGGL